MMEPSSRTLIRENGGQEPALRLMEVRPFRPFKSSEEYLWAMKEDLAEWLKALYAWLDINADTFCDALDTGVVLCQHANNVRRLALEYERSGRNGLSFAVPGEVTCRADVSTNAFHARDNVSNFISFCRALRIKDCLLFETDDLVMRKNEKSVILCLLEVARRGSKVGMLAPLLVQMEEEIDREIADEYEQRERGVDAGTCTDAAAAPPTAVATYVDCGPKRQVINNDLKSLDEMVRDLVNRCTCPTQFYMERISEGKYRIGESKLTIYVRILRSHVMVRVGGGWDTLAHYLDKHDPCRCRQGHRAAVSSKLTVKFGQNTNPSQQTHMEVTYLRSPVAPPSHPSPFLSSASGRQRSTSPMSLPPSSSPPRQRRASTSSSSSSSHKLSTGSLASLPGDGRQPAAAAAEGDAASVATTPSPRNSAIDRLSYGDSSSEHSDEGYRGSTSRLPQPPDHRKSPSKTLLRVNEGDGAAAPSDCGDCGLTNGKRPVQQDHASVNGAPAKVLHGTDRRRRSSGESPLLAAGLRLPSQRRMPRSRSNDGGDHPIELLSRNQAGRYSYRTPRGNPQRDAADRNHTWTFRGSRPSRPPLGADTFASPARMPSPRRSAVNGSPSKDRFFGNGARSLQASPSKEAISPELLQQIINSDLDSNVKVGKIQSILMNARTCGVGGRTPPELASPDSGSDMGCAEDDARLSLPQLRHLKISPRKDNHPDRESKIPVPKYEARYSIPY